MGLKRDKFRNIVGGITSSQEAESAEPAETVPPFATPPEPQTIEAIEEQRGGKSRPAAVEPPARPAEAKRFAKRGRPKAAQAEEPGSKGKKVKVSLFLSETLVNDLYEWAHDDRIHPGEMFERALKPFHDREAKRRNGGKE